MLIDVASPSLIITEQYSITYFQFLFYVSKKKQAVKNFQSRKIFKKLYQRKNARIDKKKTSFYWSRSRRKKFKTAPAPAPKGLKSTAPDGSGSTTLLYTINFFVNYF